MRAAAQIRIERCTSTASKPSYNSIVPACFPARLGNRSLSYKKEQGSFIKTVGSFIQLPRIYPSILCKATRRMCRQLLQEKFEGCILRKSPVARLKKIIDLYSKQTHASHARLLRTENYDHGCWLCCPRAGTNKVQLQICRRGCLKFPVQTLPVLLWVLARCVAAWTYWMN